MKTIKFGIIGCGRISSKHVDGIINATHAQLVAVSDVSVERMNILAHKHTISTYTDYHGLLADPEVDIVTICTPSGLHSQIAIEAAKAGKHVLLEKPMALSLTDAKKIHDAFIRSKTTLGIVFQNRYNHAVSSVKAYEDKLGKLNYINAQVYWYRDQRYYDDAWHGTTAMDGGVLTNQGSHYVDLVLYFKKQKVNRVSAFGATLKHKMECEDTITVNLAFADGTIGNIQANTITYPSNLEGALTLFYDRATIKIGGPALNKIQYWMGDYESALQETHAEQIENVYGNGHRKVIQNMVNHLLGLEELFIPGSEGIGPVEIIEGAYRSIQLGNVIDLQ